MYLIGGVKIMNKKPDFRMSSAGKCPRALSAQLNNMEVEPLPAFVMKAAEEGNLHEVWIKKKLKQEGYSVIDEQEEIELSFPSFNLIGHIDGKIKNIPYYFNANAPENKLLEIKSMSQFEYARWMKEGFSGFPNYAAQITCYMEATGLSECLYIVKNRSSGYEDRQILTEKPANMTEIIGHLTDVTNHILSGQLVPAEFDPYSVECKRCQYKNLCIPKPAELTALKKAELELVTESWRIGTNYIKLGQQLVNDAKEAIQQHSIATKQTKWRFNELAIQLVPYKESVTYPKAQLLKTFTQEQLEPIAKVKEAFNQLRITDLEKNNEES